MTKIKVIGVGGAGSNAISRMMLYQIKGVDLIAVNTDAQDLQKTKAHQKLRIGRKVAKGLGAGMNPEIGRKAAEESKKELHDLLRGSDMVFITSGFGGGTGTGASPVIADIAKTEGALTIAIATKPFFFEGAPRVRIAEKGIENLKDRVDTLFVIPNDKLLALVDSNTPLLNAFWMCDEILHQAVQGITDLIVLPGIINIDFADVKAIMKKSGIALFGMGKAKGENRIQEAVNQSINSPLLDCSIRGAKSVLFNVSGGGDISLSEVEEGTKAITEHLAPGAKVIFGAVQDKKLKNGEIKIIVIATGF